MARSLIRQLEQIRNSATYDDYISDVNNPDVAEIAVSGTMQHDMNVIRTLIKNITGTTNWYDDSGTDLTTLAGLITSSSADKYVETTDSEVTKNTEHELPGSITYTPVSISGTEGKNMDVYVGGQLLMADTGAAGVNADRDYGETTTSGVTFRFDIQSGRNITYVIRQ